jgi:hypothetical protein
MKRIRFILLLAGIIAIGFACSKSNDSKITNNMNLKSRIPVHYSDINGNWHNLTNTLDTLHFDSSDSILTRWYEGYPGAFHFYRFTIDVDTIILDYYAPDKVGRPIARRKILLSIGKDTLMIQNLNTVFPDYLGSIYKRI